MSAPSSWLDLPADHPYGLANLPYGVFAERGDGQPRRVGVRIDDLVLDAGAAAAQAGMASAQAWREPTLNAFLALGANAWAAARTWLSTVLTDPAYRSAIEPHLHALAEVELFLPFEVADYVDFYASERHASNVGSIFRPDGDALTPNWKHLPIGYHGRAGTVVVSGTPVIRPTGQRKAPSDPAPVFGPSVRLDIEAEVGFVVGGSTALGERVGVDEAEEHLFGVALFNDWSARDIQAWEYVPLGPFLGKSFASSLAAWVTPMAALDHARIPLPTQHPTPLHYLRGSAARGIDLRLEVRLNGTVISRPPYAQMYWSPEQMLAHLSVNGASLRPGDLFASGTVSGAEKGQRGSLLELAWNGTEPITLADGSTRSFLQDGDEVSISAWAPGPNGARIGLAEVAGRIAPAR